MSIRRKHVQLPIHPTKPYQTCTTMKNLSILLLVSLLFGCGKSEVDKCVDTFMVRFDTLCKANQLAIKDCSKIGFREEEEAHVRLTCLKAAGKRE